MLPIKIEITVLFGQNGNVLKLHMTKLYGYDWNDDGIMLNKRIYWEHPKQDSNSNI